MDADERRRIEHDCRNLLYRHAQLSDQGRVAEAVGLFTPDGTWIRGGKPFTGHEQMMNSSSRPANAVSRHFTSNPVVDVHDENHASAVTYYIVFRHDPGVPDPKLPLPLEGAFSAGEWHDRYVRTPDGWRFAYREVKRLFQQPG
ncbi:nuclear transport factor 2 family protein [Faunimonas sp. B44]|uniref:nuclear transport factor 2 family protein n=1 Tax=Faunimonas sp. B44 TaxID=3461493 RepID=UPI0040450ED2